MEILNFVGEKIVWFQKYASHYIYEANFGSDKKNIEYWSFLLDEQQSAVAHWYTPLREILQIF